MSEATFQPYLKIYTANALNTSQTSKVSPVVTLEIATILMVSSTNSHFLPLLLLPLTVASDAKPLCIISLPLKLQQQPTGSFWGQKFSAGGSVCLVT